MKARTSPEGVHEIPLESLEAAPDNPRTEMRELEDLAASIRVDGVLVPLLVRPLGKLGRFQLIDGERRWRAARLAKCASVPCLIRVVDERKRQELMLVTNLQRRGLTILEEARAFERLQKLGWTQASIARQIGKSQTYVNRRLLVLTLPVGVRRQVEARKLPVDRALGYESGGPRDIFEADEQLEQAWKRLRQEVLDSGDRLIIAALRDFARAYKARVEKARVPVPDDEEGVA